MLKSDTSGVQCPYLFPAMDGFTFSEFLVDSSDRGMALRCLLFRSFLLLFTTVCLIFVRNEYLIFQRILKLDYSFPDGFHSVAKDLVQKLLVSNSDQYPIRNMAVQCDT